MRWIALLIALSACGKHDRESVNDRARPPVVADPCDSVRTAAPRIVHEIVGPNTSSTIGDTFAADGDVLVTGDTNEPLDPEGNDYGVVRIRSIKTGKLVEQAKFMTKVGEHWRLGQTVAMSANQIVASDGHHVFGYQRRGSAWTQSALFELDDNDPLAALAYNGDVIAVRIAEEVRIFELGGSTWKRVASFVASDSGPLALQGDVLAIGEPSSDSSKVQIVRLGEQGWKLDEELVSPDPDSHGFGSSVAIDGDSVAVGTQYEDVVYLYRLRRDGKVVATVKPQREWPPTATFGVALSLRGRLLAVGSRSLPGVELFREVRGEWQPAGVVAPPRAHADHTWFGARIELGDVMWIGAAAHSDARRSYPGVVVGYTLGPLAQCQSSRRSDPTTHVSVRP